MPLKTRIEYAGAVYHVLDRGDRREAIFRDEEDRHRFLATLEEGEPKRLKKSDARKVVFGPWVRRHTVATNQRMAKRLWMGDATRVSRYCGSGAAVADARLRRKLEKLEVTTCEG